MSLPHAILGLLTFEPMTGYDLKTKCFDGSIAHFWPADQAQIYRTLERLRDQGWVRHTVEVQDDRPNRKVYHVTPAGDAELQRWLETADLAPPPIRESFLIQLFFADRLPDDRVRELLLARRERHEARLAAYQAVPLPPLDAPGCPRELAFQRMTLDLGLMQERANLAWVDHCLAHLDAGRAQSAPPRDLP